MKKISQVKNAISNTYGKVGVPILLYFLGVPGFAVIVIWLFFFKGK